MRLHLRRSMSDLIYLLKDIVYVNLNTGALKKKKHFQEAGTV